jgi:hypothetical protein
VTRLTTETIARGILRHFAQRQHKQVVECSIHSPKNIVVVNATTGGIFESMDWDELEDTLSRIVIVCLPLYVGGVYHPAPLYCVHEFRKEVRQKCFWHMGLDEVSYIKKIDMSEWDQPLTDAKIKEKMRDTNDSMFMVLRA